MGSSPIARSIFFIFVLLVFSPVSAQVTTDKSLPFQEGETVLLPATTAYLGDLPHFVDLVPNDVPSHTWGGLQTPLVGWSGSLGQGALGLRSGAPGLFFENIAYPLASLTANLFPASGTLQVLNFPVQGWLGPSAAFGAMNVTAPETQGRWSDRANVWGGTGTDFGVGNRFVNDSLGIDASYRHGNASISADNFSLVSKEKWFSGDGISAGTGFLGAQDGNQNYWYSTFLNLGLSSPNFQTLEFKPYFQSVQAGSQTAQDYGGFLNYLFNLAGLAQSHIGLGYDSVTSMKGLNENKGFLQSTSLVDVLGDITLDSAFRWDFSDLRNTTFSTVLGLQGKVDNWTLLGDYDKAVSPVTNVDIQEADAGARFQPEDKLALTAKYVYEQLGNNPFNGGDLEAQIDEFNGFLLFKKFKVTAEERILSDSLGHTQYDSGIGFELGVTSQDRWWLQGRCIGGRAVFLEAGLDYVIDRALKVYSDFDNLTGIAQAVPDLDRPAGFVTSVGVQISAD